MELTMNLRIYRTISMLGLLSLMAASSALAHNGMEHVMGTVTAVDDTSITVEGKDKHLTKVLVDGTTQVESAGAAATLKDVTVGSRVVIHGMDKPAGLTAAMVKIGSAKAGAMDTNMNHAAMEHGEHGATDGGGSSGAGKRHGKHHPGHDADGGTTAGH
jgi:hypothetical protein